MLEKWDYVLRRLFVLKSTALRSALGSLAPGATALIKPIAAAGVDIKQPIKKLTLADWAKIVKVFDEWPFAPEVCVHLMSMSMAVSLIYIRIW
jgi:mitochondrial transcription factor 1